MRSFVVPIGPRVSGADPLLAVVTKDDVAALKGVVLTELQALQSAVIECLTTLDASTTGSWNAQALIVVNWLASTPGNWSGVMPGPTLVDYYAQGKGLEGVLRDNWYPRLRAAGCTVPAPPGPPPPLKLSTQNPLSPLGALADLAELAPFVIAYLVFKELKF